MQWFLSYILGYRTPSGKAALLGSAAHKVLEGVALCKLHHQGESAKTDKVLGRIGKKLKLEEWKEKSFAHYKKESKGLLEDSDFKILNSHVESTVDNPYFPFNLEVVAAEQYFIIDVEKPWARYSYPSDSGVESGTLKINGVIDLVFRGDDGKLCYMDYKFGKLRDWATGKEKNYDTLHEDVQLCIYYWAIRQLLKEEEVFPYIWYAAQGKMFSLTFDESQLKLAEQTLQSIFLQMKAIVEPKCNYSYRCKWCDFSTAKFSNYGKDKMDLEWSDKCHFPSTDNKSVMCDSMAKLFRHRSINLILENMKYV